MQGETQLKAGGGHQQYPFGGLSRWGDYSSMSLDPADDCTFWYTTEYLKASGGFDNGRKTVSPVVAVAGEAANAQAAPAHH